MILMFNRDGRVKGQTYIDRRKQCKKLVPRYATPHNVSTDSVPITATIDVHEGCNVGICDMMGAFRSADMDEELKMVLRGSLDEPLVNISPQIYRHHMIYEKGRPILYAPLKKALYGCLRLEFLFYKRLVAYMRGKGFELNPYDPYVTNKMIGGKKMEVFYYLDNLEVSHMKPKEVTNVMECIEGIYGDMRITRLKVHKKLGMTLYFRTPGELRVTMVDYLKEVIEDFP